MTGVQLNLLPDVKQEYIKAQRARRIVVSVSLLGGGVAVVLLVVLLSINGLQKKHLSDLSNDITAKSKELKAKPQITRILTVQNQLQGLTDMHAGKSAVTRQFDYLNQVTTTEVDITSFTADYAAYSMSITGAADSLSSVNKYVDTLKFTTYSVKGSSAKTKAFSDVVLSSFALNGESKLNTERLATYTITLAYQPDIFDITKQVKLTVPSTVTTRSQSDRPPALFTTAPATTDKKKAGN